MTVRVVFDGPPCRPHVGRALAVIFAIPLLLVGVVGTYRLTLRLVMTGSAVFGSTSFAAKDGVSSPCSRGSALPRRWSACRACR